MYTSLPTRRLIPSTMAKVSGKRMMKRVPCPVVEVTSTPPPSIRMLLRTTSSPTPRPETSLTVSAVENPGTKINSSTCPGSATASTATPGAGAADAEAYAAEEEAREVRVHGGELESLGAATRRGVGVRAWIGGRVGYA